MSLCADDKIYAARAMLDAASARVARYVATRNLPGAAEVPPEELRQLRVEIDACRQMIDAISEAAINASAEVTHG